MGPQAPPAPPLRCARTALRYGAGPSYGLPGQSATGVNRGAGSRAAKKVRISTGVHNSAVLSTDCCEVYGVDCHSLPIWKYIFVPVNTTSLWRAGVPGTVVIVLAA